VKCRACGAAELEVVLSLGRTPLANSLLLAPDQEELTYPLDLAWCSACSLLQILDSVSPETIFREYLYFSSYSDTMLSHARDLARGLVSERGLGHGSLVIEAGSNDGYLLRHFRDAGVSVLGIEPARNVARVAEERGVRTVSEFFGAALARGLGKADVFVAMNVLAHVPDVNDFVEGIRTVLKPGGVALIETPYARDMIDLCEFDTIYHEHVFYYSVTALARLLGRHGLRIDAVERVPIHGGSLRVRAVHGTGPAPVAEPWALDRGYYAAFAARVARLKTSLLAVLEGKNLAGYGAAAKGATLLNTVGVRGLRYVVDRNPEKQGKYMPGVRVPIFPPEHLLEAPAEYVLLLTWNFAEEIMAQQAEYVRRGGRFIIPIPEPRVA